MTRSKTKLKKRNQRKKKVRAKIKRNSDNFRLSVYRSVKHIYAQIIDDEKGKTIVSANDLQLDSKKKMNKTDKAFEVGKLVAKRAQKKLTSQKAKKLKVSFDRGPYKFHGRVKALADGAREAGLEF